MTEPRTTDDFWAAAKQLGEAIAARRAADRQATKDARNARRRARYRTAPKPEKPVAVIVDETVDWQTGCLCHIAAPCGWCETGGASDD